MKTLTLATAFVVMAASFSTTGFAADDKTAKAEPRAEITFVNKKAKKRSPYVSHAIYLTDAAANKRRAQNLLIDVSGKSFKKKFLKKKFLGHGGGFGHQGFGHGGFSQGGFGHSGFGHGGFHNGGFGHKKFGHSGFGHGGTKLKKKALIGKFLFGF